MRCKNCGFENEAERYICQNCGSPLYDEDEDIESQQNGYDDQTEDGDPSDDADKKNTRNNIIIITVLAVLLVAIITGIIIFASQSGKAPEQPSDSTSTTESTEPESSSTTEPTTKKETTTKPTTESTTEPTTEPTSKETEPTVVEYVIAVDIDGYGTVTGDGKYKAGEKANLIATPSAGSQFVGWYDNATREQVASGPNYTITVQKNLNLTARFEPIETPTVEEPEEDDNGAPDEDNGNG